MATATMLLTACDTKISQDKFVAQLEATKANITLDSEALDNVHIYNKLSVHNINYKEGEFASEVNGLILTRTQKYTWIDENGRYYHYEKSLITSIDKEITKAEFDIYMATARGEICAKLNEGVANCENMLKEQADDSVYYNVKNSFAQTINGEYKMNSTMNYKTTEDGQEVEATRKTTFIFKKNLPVKYTINDNGENYYKYTYGNAEFKKPENSVANS